MYQASIHNKLFEIESDDNGIQINGQPLPWDMITVADGYFHIILDKKGYRAEIVKADVETKTFVFKINGRNYSVHLKDKFDLLLEKMGLHSGVSAKVNNIKAPMPGLIIDMKVKSGDMVKAGDPLLILEAMKMENIIKSPGEGMVKSVKAKKGDSVEKNQIIIEF
ncbi:MAG: acetyl-CoA carboxylase biotin carboxyl carrier protein subunit [Cyclobacteriaceae bacterium]|nr:acetyl-CoA carboxylase biotin carboxyl carrier protein subunit [Cyclobacteriaceae bacterium]